MHASRLSRPRSSRLYLAGCDGRGMEDNIYPSADFDHAVRRYCRTGSYEMMIIRSIIYQPGPRGNDRPFCGGYPRYFNNYLKKNKNKGDL